MSMVRIDGRSADRAKQAMINGKAARATYLREGAARLLARARAAIARVLSRRADLRRA
jgi:hypothetical protein